MPTPVHSSPLDFPPRQGPRPKTTGREIPHDQLDQPSPPEVYRSLLKFAGRLPDTLLGQSLVSDPRSVGLRVVTSHAPRDAFLWQDEFAHIHHNGFLHLTLPLPLVSKVIADGWGEAHPITRRPEFPDTIVMLYAPRDNDQLHVVSELLSISHSQAHSATDSGEPR